MNMYNIVTKAYRFCKRNVTATQKGGVLRRMCIATGSGCDFEIDKDVNTACWRFDSAKNRHEIKCGTSLDRIANADTQASEAKMKKFIQQIIRHETEHGIQTDRTNVVSIWCKDHGIPFRLYNLFEDCRIEYNSAIRKDGDGAFRWTNYQDVDASYNLASSLLWATKINEAGIKKSASAYVPAWSGSEYMEYNGKRCKTRLIVLAFYRRIIATTCSMNLMPICLEWIELFGKEIQPSMGDDTINGEVDPTSEEGEGEEIDETVQVKVDDTNPDQDRVSGWWSQKSKPVNDQQISRIARAMNAIMTKAKSTKNKLSTIGSKISVDHVIQGSERSFFKRGRTRGKRKVSLIVDASGSMECTWNVHGGREFVLAFRELARKNLIDLDILLTQVDSSRRAVSKRINKDDTDKWINDLDLDGCGEGVMQCIKRFLPLIKKSTTSIIFTDARLTDDDIDTQFYRNLGLNMIASYIEPSDWAVDMGRSRMDQHFARSVIATNATELARRLMREILKD